MGKKLVIVAVDDIKAIRILVNKTLSDAGFTVILGEDSKQGMELAKNITPISSFLMLKCLL